VGSVNKEEHEPQIWLQEYALCYVSYTLKVRKNINSKACLDTLGILELLYTQTFMKFH
jgi:hypothetical protein